LEDEIFDRDQYSSSIVSERNSGEFWTPSQPLLVFINFKVRIAEAEILQLSNEHIAQLRQARAIALVPRFIEQLQAHAVLDQAQWTSDTLRDDTVAHVELALNLGLRSGRDVLGFLMLRHTLGAGFESRPSVKEALTTPSQPEGWRVYSMMHTFSSACWVVARDTLPREARS
jgi:hypothetical protein